MNVRSRLAVVVALVTIFGRLPASAQVPYAYVPSAADGTVSAVDLKTDRVVWTVRIGERAAHGIAASVDGTVVFAGDAVAQEVVVIDAKRQTIIKRISVPFRIHGIDISPESQA